MVDYLNRSGHTVSVPAETTHYLMGIEGMSCLACANRVKQTLESSIAVEEAKVFFENASAIVTVTPRGDVQHIVDLVHNLHDKYHAKVIESW